MSAKCHVRILIYFHRPLNDAPTSVDEWQSNTQNMWNIEWHRIGPVKRKSERRGIFTAPESHCGLRAASRWNGSPHGNTHSTRASTYTMRRAAHRTAIRAKINRSRKKKVFCRLLTSKVLSGDFVTPFHGAARTFRFLLRPFHTHFLNGKQITKLENEEKSRLDEWGKKVGKKNDEKLFPPTFRVYSNSSIYRRKWSYLSFAGCTLRHYIISSNFFFA